MLLNSTFNKHMEIELNIELDIHSLYICGICQCSKINRVQHKIIYSVTIQGNYFKIRFYFMYDALYSLYKQLRDYLKNVCYSINNMNRSYSTLEI